MKSKNGSSKFVGRKKEIALLTSVFDLLCRHVFECSKNRFFLLVIDNLQWADRSSLQMLEFLCQQSRSQKLCILITYRNPGLNDHHALGACLAEIRQEMNIEQLVLKEFSIEEVTEYIEKITGLSQREFDGDELLSLTTGNPLYLTEVVRNWKTGTPGAELITQDTPNTLHRTILQRVHKLDNEVISLLGIAAHIGRSFSPALVGEVTKLDKGKIYAGLEAAQGASLISVLDDPSAWQFTHGLIQDALSSTVTAEDRAEVHRRIAQALETDTKDSSQNRAAEIAKHYEQSLTGRNENSPEIRKKCLAYSIEAGKYALKEGNFTTCAEFFQNAVACATNDTDRPTLALAYGQLGVAETVLALPSAVSNVAKAVDLYCELGRYEEALKCAIRMSLPDICLSQIALETLQKVVETAVSETPALALAKCHLAASRHSQDHDHAQFRSIVDAELRIIQNSAAEAEELIALSTALVVDYFHVLKDEDLYRRFFFLAAKHTDVNSEVYGRLTSSYFAFYYPKNVDECSEGQKHVDAAVFRSEQVRDHLLIANSLLARARVYCITGNWRQCQADLDRAVRLHPLFLASTPTRLRGLIAAEGEDWNTLTEIFNSQIGSLPEPEVNINAVIELAWLLVWCAIIIGTPRHLGKAEELCLKALSTKTIDNTMAWRALIALGLLAAARTDGKRAAVYEKRIKVFEQQNDRFLLSNCLMRAIVALAAGDPDRAADLFEKQLQIVEETGGKTEKVWTVRFIEDFVRRNQDYSSRFARRDLLREALFAAKDIGMKVSSARIEVFLNQFEHESHERKWPCDLTDRESQVLRLIALGKTNQEISKALFISEYTVANHVSHIFSKINVTNRTAAAAFAVRHQIAQLAGDSNL